MQSIRKKITPTTIPATLPGFKLSSRSFPNIQIIHLNNMLYRARACMHIHGELSNFHSLAIGPTCTLDSY